MKKASTARRPFASHCTLSEDQNHLRPFMPDELERRWRWLGSRSMCCWETHKARLGVVLTINVGRISTACTWGRFVT
jgi:hypothetical protein